MTMKHPFALPTAPATLIDLVRWRAEHQSDQQVYRFLQGGEVEDSCLSYQELDQRAQAIGALLQSAVAPGARALLLYPPGLDYIAAFFGCLYAGVVAVPAYPPNPARIERTLPRLQAIVADARPAVALTTSPILAVATFLGAQVPEFQAMSWHATDTIDAGMAAAWREPALSEDTLAFLQYTSGS